MNILVTGGAGFIGTHVTRSLLNQGYSVTVLDNFLPQIHAGNNDLASDLRSHVRLVRGNIADPSALTGALEGVQCVVHLAAETGTGQSMYEVVRYEQTNLAGTALLYDLLIKNPRHSVERIVVASSRAIYGEGAYGCAVHGIVYPASRSTAEKELRLFDPVCPDCQGPCSSVPTPESAPFQASSFYGLTKQIQEQMVLMFGRALQIPSIALRYQNVYGPGQSLHNPYTGILAIFSNLARKRSTIQVFEDGMESRDFVYIDDAVRATCACLTVQVKSGESVNIGSNERTTVLDVARNINEYYGSVSDVRITGAFREGDIRHGLADITKAGNLLRYEPRWMFRDGLRSFLEWADETEPTSAGYERSLIEMKERGLLRG
jgi:dTDP-L-rhamnose 4-epimerase